MSARFALAIAATFTVAAGQLARADMWCASTVVADEWGVHVFGADGRALPGGELPDWFFASATTRSGTRPAVRTLPADNGVRKLPVLTFYGGASAEMPLPIGLEVGFAAGIASRWYPDVDRLRPRERRQLIWDRLDLTPAPLHAPVASGIAWITQSRAGNALWVNDATRSERFVFYEADTLEPVPLAITRGASWSPTHRHYVLTNNGKHAVHDVFVVHHDGRTFVVKLASIAAGAHADFVLEDHVVSDTRTSLALLRERLTIVPADGKAPMECLSGRVPATPFEHAVDHRLHAAEVDVILSVWGRRFFEGAGTRVVYREDTAYLDAVMPLSIYTDMFHSIELHRAGLALWEDVALP